MCCSIQSVAMWTQNTFVGIETSAGMMITCCGEESYPAQVMRDGALGECEQMESVIDR